MVRFDSWVASCFESQVWHHAQQGFDQLQHCHECLCQERLNFGEWLAGGFATTSQTMAVRSQQWERTVHLLRMMQRNQQRPDEVTQLQFYWWIINIPSYMFQKMIFRLYNPVFVVAWKIVMLCYSKILTNSDFMVVVLLHMFPPRHCTCEFSDLSGHLRRCHPVLVPLGHGLGFASGDVHQEGWEVMATFVLLQVINLSIAWQISQINWYCLVFALGPSFGLQTFWSQTLVSQVLTNAGRALRLASSCTVQTIDFKILWLCKPYFVRLWKCWYRLLSQCIASICDFPLSVSEAETGAAVIAAQLLAGGLKQIWSFGIQLCQPLAVTGPWLYDCCMRGRHWIDDDGRSLMFWQTNIIKYHFGSFWYIGWKKTPIINPSTKKVSNK